MVSQEASSTTEEPSEEVQSNQTQEEASSTLETTNIDKETPGQTAPATTNIDKETADAPSGRDSLRREMTVRRSTLTKPEFSYLENLVVNATEIEVELARKKLVDDSIFFEIPVEEEKESSDEDNLDEGFGKLIEIGREQSDGSKGPGNLTSLKLSRGVSNASLHSKRSITSHGSEKVQKQIAFRRSSSLHNQMWRAHQNGIAVSATGSKKSVLRRSLSGSVLLTVDNQPIRRSMSFLSSETKDLILEGGPKNRPGEAEIFRGDSAMAKDDSGKQSITDISPSIPKSIFRPPEIPRPEFPRPASMSGLRRYASEGGRKSVTFKGGNKASDGITPLACFPARLSPKMAGKLCRELSLGSLESALTIESPMAQKRTLAGRSPSLSSIPSLHIGVPIRSDSLSSIPSLHRGLPIRSGSFSSISSMRKAGPLRSRLRADSIASIASLHRAATIMSEISTESDDPVWSSPLLALANVEEKKDDCVADESNVSKPVLLRRASRNVYEGEGIEASEWDASVENISKARMYASMLSIGEHSIQSASSWDENLTRPSIFRESQASLSDDELADYFLGRSNVLAKDSFKRSESLAVVARPDDLEDDKSWDMESESEYHYDAWNIMKDEYAMSFGAGGAMPMFRIFGTSVDDESAMPHVLSPPLMESLQQFFPIGVSEHNFWMKYSMARDGASLFTLLQQIRGAKHSIIAIETSDGEVFGSFTSEPWRKSWNYFGTGESFLWRMRESRNTPCFSVIDQAQLESDLDVYPWTGENNCVQMCNHEKIVVGGGTPSSEDSVQGTEYGFGLAVTRDILFGTSSFCATFGSPPLSRAHQDGSPFEIVNLEVWTLTPCSTLQDAEKLELGKLFLTGQ